MPKEILTLQFGSYANYIGTHYWNIQDELLGGVSTEDELLQHELAFDRTFVTSSKGHFPRAMIFDCKSAFLEAPQYGENEEGEYEWTGPQNPFHEYLKSPSSSAPDSFNLGLDNVVNNWSDFSKVHFDKKSFQTVPLPEESAASASGVRGILGSSSTGTEAQYEESLRWFMEEADSLQGFHVVLDADTAFGGLALDVLTHIRDEYPKATIFAFPTASPFPTSRDLRQQALDVRKGGGLGSGMSLTSLSKLRNWNICYNMAHLLSDDMLSNVCIPLSLGGWAADVQQHAARTGSMGPPGLVMGSPVVTASSDASEKEASSQCWFPMTYLDMDKPFSTSAYLASVLDTITLPQRKNQYTKPRVPEGAEGGVRSYTPLSAKGWQPLKDSAATATAAPSPADLVKETRPAYAALPEPTSLTLLSQAMNPEGPHRLLTARAACPFPHPLLTASDADSVFHHMSTRSIRHLAPSSWPQALPSTLRSMPASLPPPKRSIAALLLTRGVAALKDPQPFSSAPLQPLLPAAGPSAALSRLLDKFTQHASERGFHFVAATPLPIPRSFPTFLPEGLSKGGASATHAWGCSAVAGPPKDGEESKGEEELAPRPATTDSTVPHSVPMAVWVEAGEEAKLLLDALVPSLPRSHAIPASWKTDAEEVSEVREVLSSVLESYTTHYDEEV